MLDALIQKKSTFGYLFLLDGGAISWKSEKQSIIVASTMETEFAACFEATVHGYNYETLFKDLSNR